MTSIPREFNFNPFPVLYSDRLCLREIHSGDANTIFNLYRDPLVMKYRGAELFSDVSEGIDLIKSFQDQYRNKDGVRWGICMNSDKDRIIGTAGIRGIQPVHRRAEIGYELSPDYWNRGLMTEALMVITKVCFDRFKLHSLEANIAPSNLASKRVLEKLNFRQEAHYRENWYFKGWWDSAIYTLHDLNLGTIKKFS
jgi:ribosomal-protein-alanine N-acetyltransferase